ncbi:hypothetical protein JAAARDRAFT_54221 [Jaapia argillacea MUCL 33604]|uniref:Methyltransferase domain-containing protein n=1 Tax=Jaapia argillacea MUCL 33604 TaxID=933084 RepID=A0A067Q5I2_9AGAM|nr:hypothetical protein JAAARDRAFT_54221 [Jaapia argillacea MUCL 33604]
MSAPNDTWSASSYNETASFVYSSANISPVLSLLDAKPGEKIIDFGCGSGEVTLEIEKVVTSKGDGLVVGVDASDSMISKAGSNGLRFCFVSDIQSIQFPRPTNVGQSTTQFDAVFTNAALHWCKRDPKGVLESVKKVLIKGGRFVGEMGGFSNCVGVRSALHHVLRGRGHDPVILDPWYFPSVEDYRTLLEAHSFKVDHISLTPRLTPLPSTLRDWLHLFCRHSFLEHMSDEEAESVIEEVQERCRIDCQDGQGKWWLMYTRLRFKGILLE